MSVNMGAKRFEAHSFGCNDRRILDQDVLGHESGRGT